MARIRVGEPRAIRLILARCLPPQHPVRADAPENGGENAIGILSAVIFGIIFCYSFRLSGSLWFAVGVHASWDYCQSYVFGVPDSGVVVPGSLMKPIISRCRCKARLSESQPQLFKTNEPSARAASIGWLFAERIRWLIKNPARRNVLRAG